LALVLLVYREFAQHAPGRDGVLSQMIQGAEASDVPERCRLAARLKDVIRHPEKLIVKEDDQ
jgi:hypothetical protein